jgi:type III pantothenate kinase
MLLAVDAGNTQTVLGVFEGERLRFDWRVSTRKTATADEVGVVLRSLFGQCGLDPSAVNGMIVSSVVPDLDAVLQETGRGCFGLDPLFVGPGIRTGLPILYENPHDVGADRIVNAVAAVERLGAPVLVLDFGTATTLDVVNESGQYLGGIIAPGLGISAEALFQRAARLPRVDVRPPERAIGRNTVDSIRSGLFFGYASMVRGMVQRARSELGGEAPVIATGGLAPVFRQELDFLAEIDPGLTLEGLRLLWDKNHR